MSDSGDEVAVSRESWDRSMACFVHCELLHACRNNASHAILAIRSSHRMRHAIDRRRTWLDAHFVLAASASMCNRPLSRDDARVHTALQAVPVVQDQSCNTGAKVKTIPDITHAHVTR
jgi:hypothetical protein